MQPFARNDCPFFKGVTARMTKAREKFAAIDFDGAFQIARTRCTSGGAAMFVLTRALDTRAKFLNIERVRTRRIELDGLGRYQ